MTTDLFSKQSDLYAVARPRYPQALFDFLAQQCNEHSLAWDCATGNGQAAVDLAKRFEHVIATDLSEKQIANATHVSNIEYKILKAEERLPITDHTVDLVTVAQALHWFDLKPFYAEVKRVLKPQGVFATWAYGMQESLQSEIDALIHHFHFETLGPFWRSNNHMILNEYRDLEFPFREIEAPPFWLETKWTLDQTLACMRTWSATQAFIAQHHIDPTIELGQKISHYWGDPNAPKSWRSKLVFKVGMQK